MSIHAETIKLAAVCLFGLEKLLGEEIDALAWAGVRRTETMDGRVLLEAPAEAIPVLNLRLRFAERVLILAGRRAASFTRSNSFC